jgi:RNase P protein component
VKSILQSFQRTSAHDLIFVASIKAKGIKFETLRADLTQLIQEANINWGRK